MIDQESGRVAFETARLRLARVQHSTGAARTSGFRLVTQVVADALEVARVGIWMLADRDEHLVCKLQFMRGRGELHGETLDLRRFPRYLAALAERRAVAADDARTHPATSELGHDYLVPHGILSMLDGPIIRDGRLVGVICVEATAAARSWKQTEIDFVGSAADIVALVLEQADRVELEAALKEQTEQRLESQKLEALGRMARSVAHDLNNLLTVVLAVADDARGGSCATCLGASASLAGTAEVGRRLVRQLLDLGQREAVPAATIDVGAVLAGMLPTLKALVGGDIALGLQASAEAPLVRMQQAELEQVLLNLVVNARDSIRGSGSIDIVLRDPFPDDELSVDQLVLEVADTGSGMDEHTRAHLFEPYFTTKANGSGLGLATVYGIVMRAGGTLHVASTPGRGTTFRICLRRDLRPLSSP